MMESDKRAMVLMMRKLAAEASEAEERALKAASERRQQEMSEKQLRKTLKVLDGLSSTATSKIGEAH